MAIELREENTGLNEGYKADLMGMLVGETEAGNISWKPDHSYGSTWYEAKLSENLTAQITPFEFDMSNKHVRLFQKIGSIKHQLTIDRSSKFFESRVIELEKAIFDKLYKADFNNVFESVRNAGKKELPKLKAYPNDAYLGKDNLPAKAMSNESKSVDPVKKVKNYDKFIDQIRMPGKEANHHKKVTISFDNITIIIEN